MRQPAPRKTAAVAAASLADGLGALLASLEDFISLGRTRESNVGSVFRLADQRLFLLPLLLGASLRSLRENGGLVDHDGWRPSTGMTS